MAKKVISLYNEKINEFVDWKTGDNSLTGGNDTNGLPVSGGSIRELLQTKLKHPVHVERYKDEHLYRIFSSEDAKEAWERTKDDNLVIASFVAPSEYQISVSLKSKQHAYIRYGIEGQEGSIIRYSWKTENDKGNVFSENVSVTYNNTTTGKSYPTLISPNPDENENVVEQDMSKYIQLGNNNIKILFKGMTTGAELEMDVVITTVQFNIDTSLNYSSLQSNGKPLSFNLYANRNITGPLSFKSKRIYYGSNDFDDATYISEIIDSSKNISLDQENSLNPSDSYSESGDQSSVNLKSRMHSLQVWGQMEIDDKIFHSNLIYYYLPVGLGDGESVGTKPDGISFRYEFNNRIDFLNPGEFSMLATQYESLEFDWAYIRYLDLAQSNISWFLREVNTQNQLNYTDTFINIYQCSPNQPAPKFTFIPTIYTRTGYKTYLIAAIDTNGDQIISNNERILIQIPIIIQESTLGISETTGANLTLKLSAYGRQNSGSNVSTWEYGDYYTSFAGLKWNSASGWYDNSLRLSGSDQTALINFNAFTNIDMDNDGLTVEVDFEPDFVASNNDELIRIGSNISTEPHISIYPNKAQLFIEGNALITTNYKANERVKLAFIVEPRTGISEELRNVVFIVNNGICERAAGWKDYQPSAFTSNSGSIKIGGTNSGIRVYGIRCYSKAITITNAYNNYVYDSDNKSTIVANNNIYTAGLIDIEKCRSKGDVIIIKGNLSKILDRKTTKDGSNSDCDIERICISDSSRNFTVQHGRIRKHGQSTLNYPLTSYKLWTWSSVDDTRPTMTLDASTNLPFTKNRYQMKDNSIPANKFVLQANYADSSGVHNGGFERLIQETWYNAKFKVGNSDEYKLRTQPQLFSSNQTISPQIWNENGQQVGDTEMTEVQQMLFSGKNSSGKQWKDYFGEVKFPYTIRNSPDSFPCLVFYQNDEVGDTAPKFLGQYVFMDDKKSDFVYGERSIYKVQNTQAGTNNAADPFCVKSNAEGTELWNEELGTKIWDNDKVLRIECLSVNSTLADFRGVTADNSGRRFDNVILGDSDENTSIGWEEDFELVYPEKEEITTKKQFDAQKFVDTVQPFTDWLEWIIGTEGNQQEFQRTAAAHLDLYKMAAYYIFVLRFGLVDSLERNAQLKTYDGIHWHYEPWDMDIALGNRNTGGIAFDPPISRDTMMDNTTAAISGKSIIDTNADTIPDTMVSNWLWDALEAWPYWINTIVPDVAAALFEAGLTYQNVIKMLDEEYQNAWCESIYNESGSFKYVVNRQNTDDNGNILPGYNDDWLAWLQGARTTHRHWWLRTSMDYYDAKWGVGEFTQRNMYLACEMHNVQGTIDLMPTADTYFSFQREATKFGPFAANTSTGYSFDMSVINSGAKVPFTIFGANFIKEIDISDIAAGLQVFAIANAYSSEVGPVITKVNIGVPITTETSSHMEGAENGKDVTIEAGNSLNAIEELNVRGQRGSTSALNLSFLGNTKTIRVLKAAGSGLRALTSAIGTDYDTLELPDTLTSITFNSTTWDTSKLSFWTTTSGQIVTRTYTQEATDEQGNILYEEDGVTPIMEEYQVQEITQSQYDKFNLNDNQIITSIPRNLISVSFTGTTGKNACARQFVVDWINSIISWGTSDWTNNVNDVQNETVVVDGETVLRYSSLDDYLESLFRARRLQVENIYWNNTTIPGLSLQQLYWLSRFNNIDYSNITGQHPNITNFSTGYVVITDGTEISGIQASELTTWFGSGVFRLNSGGLVIDQPLNNYTAISVGNPAYVENGEIYLKEGERVQISATKFKLQTNLGSTTFNLALTQQDTPRPTLIYPVGSGRTACTIQEDVVGEDHFYFLQTYPNATGQGYTINLISGGTTLPIHIVPLDYPEYEILTVSGYNKSANNGTISSEYIYYKDCNLFVLPRTGTKEFGILFKETNALGEDVFLRKPSNKDTQVEYVKFKLYKDGVMCSAFGSYGLDYNYFTQNESIESVYVDNGDLNLGFLKGYRQPSVYDYFIPLNVVSTPLDPILYELVVELKIGGKVEELRQKFTICNEGTGGIASEGTGQWGLLNKSYVEQFNTNFDSAFTKSVGLILTGNISVDGQYQSGANFVNVSDNLANITNLIAPAGGSIFNYLPNITGIKLDGLTIPSTSLDGATQVTNIDVTGLTKLRSFSIQNCINLTNDIDLNDCSNITQVDASGTNINVFVPDGVTLTKYELGTPTAIHFTNIIVPINSVSIENNSNIDDVQLININSSASFSMFDKVTSVESAKDIIIRNNSEYMTPLIPIPEGGSVLIEHLSTDPGFSVQWHAYAMTYPTSDGTGGEGWRMQNYTGNGIYSVEKVYGQNSKYASISVGNDCINYIMFLRIVGKLNGNTETLFYWEKGYGIVNG